MDTINLVFAGIIVAVYLVFAAYCFFGHAVEDHNEE